MKVHCIYCHQPTVHRGTITKMRCICDEDHRFLNIEDILLGFHKDKVYLLEKDDQNVYAQKDYLYTGLPDVR